MRTPLILAAVLWTSASFAQQTDIKTSQGTSLTVTPDKVQFVPPAELVKPGRPQASAPNAYTVSMTVQGINATKQPWTVTFPVRSYEARAIVSPRDAASGLPTGKRMHKPISIKMLNGVSTPLLAQHLKANEVISSVTLNFTPVTAGAATHTFLIREVQNATLTAFADYSEMAFVFQKIQWTWVEGGKTSLDDWEAPTA